jgi:hypothetical protein
MPAAAIRHLYLHAVTASPVLHLERHKLDRLRELRATIDALRQEKSSQDPLMAWVAGQPQQPPPHSD